MFRRRRLVAAAAVPWLPPPSPPLPLIVTPKLADPSLLIQSHSRASPTSSSGGRPSHGDKPEGGGQRAKAGEASELPASEGDRVQRKGCRNGSREAWRSCCRSPARSWCCRLPQPPPLAAAAGDVPDLVLAISPNRQKPKSRNKLKKLWLPDSERNIRHKRLPEKECKQIKLCTKVPSSKRCWFGESGSSSLSISSYKSPVLTKKGKDGD